MGKEAGEAKHGREKSEQAPLYQDNHSETTVNHNHGIAQERTHEKPSNSALDNLSTYKCQASGISVQKTNVAPDDGRLAINFVGGKEITANIPAPIKAYVPPNIGNSKPPNLNIVIQIVGSRGDIQPFIALGTALRALGHRVRIATHDIFQDFVKTSGLEFFPIGGDPASLMAYMVKNPGLIPKLKTIMNGDISKKRRMVYSILQGCWRSCIEPDPVTNDPFVAEAIIANPPSFAHVHCAEALGIPLHLVFTMPWSPTRAFPHPLANIERSDMDPRTTNYLSYALVEVMTWQGLGDIINMWRRKSLCLERISSTIGPLLSDNLQIPFTYCWSPSFVPKPADWPHYIDVCGFFFRKEPEYSPNEELRDFLSRGPRPVYIGFGSIVIDDPERLTTILIKAVQVCQARAIISRGWSKLGSASDQHNDPNILFIDDCPHEWLFKQVSCVVHHGGAGTTACGLSNGCPTAIIPFFGDQAFWGQMIASAGAGPLPLHHRLLTKESLIKAIKFCLTPSAISVATRISEKMKQEDGVQAAISSFQKNLPIEALRCDIFPSDTAVWCYTRKIKKMPKRIFKLSDRAAFILVAQKRIDQKLLKLYQSKPISIENVRWDPISAGTQVLFSTMMNITYGLTDFFTGPTKIFQSRTGGGGPKEAAKTIGKGVWTVATAIPKTILVDFPLALTEGLHQMPKLYGEEVRDYGKVKGWKSGGLVAGKNFGYGFMDGFSGTINKPYKGAKEDGWTGLGKGAAKGAAGLITGTGSGMLGLFAYPLFGIYKSIACPSLTPAEEKILFARLVYASYMARQRMAEDDAGYKVDEDRVLSMWDCLTMDT